VTKDVHMIYEAYAPNTGMAVPPQRPAVPPVRPQVAPVVPVAAAASAQPIPAQNAQQPASLNLKLPIDTERKAQHAAFDILELIYSNVPNFETATNIVAEIVRVHRREAKRQLKSKA